MTTPTPDPMDEIVYEVDEDDNVVREVRRGDLTEARRRHRCAAVLCRDEQGRILVHRRAKVKRVFPQFYDMFVAGMVPAGESYEQAAVRECGEEAGQIGVELSFIGKYRYDGDDVPSWTAVFETVVTGPVLPQESEVEWFDFLTEAELRAVLDAREWRFCPDSLELYRRAFIDGEAGVALS